MATKTFSTSTITGSWSLSGEVDGTITGLSITGDSYITIDHQEYSGNSFSAYGSCQPDNLVRITATVTYSTGPIVWTVSLYRNYGSTRELYGTRSVTDGEWFYPEAASNLPPTPTGYSYNRCVPSTRFIVQTNTSVEYYYTKDPVNYKLTIKMKKSDESQAQTLGQVSYREGSVLYEDDIEYYKPTTPDKYVYDGYSPSAPITMNSDKTLTFYYERKNTHTITSYGYDVKTNQLLTTQTTEDVEEEYRYVYEFAPTVSGYTLVQGDPVLNSRINITDDKTFNYYFYDSNVVYSETNTDPELTKTESDVKDALKNQIRADIVKTQSIEQFGEFTSFTIQSGELPIVGEGILTGTYTIGVRIENYTTIELSGTYRYSLIFKIGHDISRQLYLDGTPQTIEYIGDFPEETYNINDSRFKPASPQTIGGVVYVLTDTDPKGDFTLTDDILLRYYMSSSSKAQTIDIDMTDYIVEKGVYDTKLAGRGSTGRNIWTPTIRKNLAYYVRGQRDIRGLTAPTQVNSLGVNTSVIEQWGKIINNEVKKISQTTPTSIITAESHVWWRFKIEYTSLGEQTYNISRGTDYQRVRNNMTRTNNQDNSSVDVDKFVTFNTNKLNRLSNQAIMIQQRGADVSDIAEMFQTFENKYIIFSKDIVFKRRSVDVDYLAGEKYVLANYFTSINSQKRNFEAVDNSQSVKRAEAKKIYYELGFNAPDSNINFRTVQYNNITLSPVLNRSNNERMIKLYALSPFIDSKKYSQLLGEDSRNIKVLTSEDAASTDPTFSYRNWLCTPGSMQCVNNIVAYNMQLEDTTNAGFKAEWHDRNRDKTEGYPVDGYYNTGAEYNADKTRRRFKYLSIMLGGHKYIDELILKGGNNPDAIRTAAEKLPLNVDESTTQSTEGATQTFVLPMYKDNAEKLGLAMNFEWVSNNSDIEILEPAENSLYKVSSDYENIETKNLTQYFNTRGSIGKIPVTSGSMKISANGTELEDDLKPIGLYYANGRYYANNNSTVEIMDLYNSGDSPEQYTFVYNTYTGKLVLRDLRADPNYSLTYTPEKEIEIRPGDAFYFWSSEEHSGVPVRVKKEYIFDRYDVDEDTIYCSEYTEISQVNTQDLVNITGGTGSADIANGTLTVTPTSGANEITINNSIRIKNVQQHLTQGQLVLYLKVKDYFV